MSKIEDSVANKIIERAEHGVKKYKQTMERHDLTTLQWLNHHQEELMDALVYSEKLIEIEEERISKLKIPNVDGDRVPLTKEEKELLEQI